ncbi:class I SAM-dependent methyltransferase [Parvibaculum sp.]|uniref:class I SAM-dependent methyltransferase n=4 Tax=Parvibaculum sp. TaxID=2024848 RepID=UPI003298E874
MSNPALVNLATVGSDELQTMPMSVFTAALDQMSAEAIVRFRRMRKLNAMQRSAVEKTLAKRPKPPGEADDSDGADAKSSGKPEKKRAKEAGTVMEILLRVIAWWEGMETDDVARAKGITRKAQKQKPSSAAIKKPAAPAMPEKAEPPKSLSRLEIIQELWGPGFSLPGSADFALRVASLADFTRKGRFLDLTPGLGGGMRAVAAKHGVSILGIEHDLEIAAEAMRLSAKEGMSETAPVHACGPDGLEPADFNPAGGHAAIFMREAMFAVADREKMLAEIHRGLCDGGSLVLTDFVLADGIDTEMDEAAALTAWRAAEGGIASPWSEAEYRQAIAAQDYKLESFADISSEYLPLIQAGWRQLHDCLQNAKLLPETAPTLIEEGAVWLARSQALETKQLRLVLIRAIRLPARNGGAEAGEYPASQDAGDIDE